MSSSNVASSVCQATSVHGMSIQLGYVDLGWSWQWRASLHQIKQSRCLQLETASALANSHVYVASVGVRSNAIRVSVCLHVYSSVRSYISKTSPNFTKFSVHGRGSVFLWRRYNYGCTSGFLDDVIFSDNETRTRDNGCVLFLETGLLQSETRRLGRV